ncbi:hypothetical protein [Brachybacterium sp. GPGPB12]|uniref:hypothetical protein n=1 Tax=Brachybacterium sp. GPGPB12 TaxID=3023517 RepID=UPI0031344200
MPGSFAVTVLGRMSMAGLPPMLGFVSKESLLTGALETGGPAWAPWAVALGIAGASVLTFAYCAKIVLGAFVDGRDEELLARVDGERVPSAPDAHDATGALVRAEDAHAPGLLFLGPAARADPGGPAARAGGGGAGHPRRPRDGRRPRRRVPPPPGLLARDHPGAGPHRRHHRAGHPDRAGAGAGLRPPWRRGPSPWTAPACSRRWTALPSASPRGWCAPSPPTTRCATWARSCWPSPR